MSEKKVFQIAASISFSIALLHLIIIFIGADAYRYFGASEEMAVMAEGGSYYPPAITFFIVLVFSVFGLYAFSATGKIKKLPWLKVVLSIITAIYLLRGFGVFIEVLGIIYDYDVPLRHAVFSFVALSTGLIHLTGLVKSWRSL